MSANESVPISIYDITVTDHQGNEVKLEKYRGKCLLIVNIATKCKLMKANFDGLRSIKQKFKDELAILMFPSNQFMGMPKKDPQAIKQFLNEEKIDFAEVFSPTDLNGMETHSLYKFLKSKSPGVISWNFVKFLVSKNGDVQKFNHFIVFPTVESEIRKLI